MNKTAKIILGIVIAIIVVVGAYFGVKYFFNTQEASNNNTNINNTNGSMALVENNTVENNIIENNTVTENNIVEGLEEWVKDKQEHGIKFCILSNTNKKRKAERMSKILDMPYVYFAKKPLKFGFEKAKKMEA